MSGARTGPRAGERDALISLAAVHFRYDLGPSGLDAPFELEVPELELRRGQKLACIGPSGCGKTTLIHLISGVLRPHSGRVCFDGHELSAASERERRALRLREIGMVFQEFELLDYLSALDNILLPYHLGGGLRLDSAVRARARELAGELGIARLLAHSPARLSQGERQRVALCRALITRPKLLLCDEATGNLDPEATGASLHALFEAVEREGAGLILVTHDRALLPHFERVLDMAQLRGRRGAALEAPGGSA